AFLFAALLEALLLDIPQEVRVIVRPLRPRLLIELLILPTAQLAYCRRVAAARPEGLPQHHDRDDDQDQDNEATQGCDAPSRQKNSAKCLPSTLATSWGEWVEEKWRRCGGGPGWRPKNKAQLVPSEAVTVGWTA